MNKLKGKKLKLMKPLVMLTKTTQEIRYRIQTYYQNKKVGKLL